MASRVDSDNLGIAGGTLRFWLEIEAAWHRTEAAGQSPAGEAQSPPDVFGPPHGGGQSPPERAQSLLDGGRSPHGGGQSPLAGAKSLPKESECKLEGALSDSQTMPTESRSSKRKFRRQRKELEVAMFGESATNYVEDTGRDWSRAKRRDRAQLRALCDLAGVPVPPEAQKRPAGSRRITATSASTSSTA